MAEKDIRILHAASVFLRIHWKNGALSCHKNVSQTEENARQSKS